ncbi:MAG TPA: aminotransferase class V-fold PLP-dependent enzyme [Acetobacteraceae bacterium]|nr:aminotransferase class V-fold PLP-dependent enzyme [Acetobacteraceae bacterium]
MTRSPLLKEVAFVQQKPRGRQFFANPGPTNIPDSVLLASAHASVDFNDPAFLEVYDACVDGLKRVLGTQHHLFLYAASGHGAWEATLVNLCSPGDCLLMLETGYFSESWSALARKHGLEVETVAADWRRGVELVELRRKLAEDKAHRFHAVCVVHNETSTGVRFPVEKVRAALDEVGHPALLLADTISSLASMDFRMDEWGIDGVVGGSQKGLMLPAGLSFTAASEKAMEAHRRARLPRFYFDWSQMLTRRQKSFVGTVPISFFYAMRESIRLLEEEGLAQVFARHHRLAEGVRRAVHAWGGNAGPQIFCTDPARRSDSVTAILMPEGFDADAIRRTVLSRFNVSLGGGLGSLGGKVFRIGHLGDLNEPMVLGALGAVEMSLRLNRVPHSAGGVDAAMNWYAEAA